jgi:pimeloyl-ACP methyl ester carboxylesterase
MFRGRRNVAQEPNVLLVGSVLLTICLALLAGASHAADATNPMTPQAVPAQVPAKEGIAQIANGKLFYWDTGGSGPAVILLHPATGSALMWVYQQPVFAKAGYRVIGYSRRGYYNSDPIAKENPGVAADDLHQLVELLGIQKFHAVSSAAGGSIATDYALSHPERLHS